MLADEDAADSYHGRPEEHPSAVCLEPFRHHGATIGKTSLHADEGAERKAEGVRCMSGEEAVAATIFEYIEPIGQHELIMERSYASDCMLDDI